MVIFPEFVFSLPPFSLPEKNETEHPLNFLTCYLILLSLLSYYGQRGVVFFIQIKSVVQSGLSGSDSASKKTVRELSDSSKDSFSIKI